MERLDFSFSYLFSGHLSVRFLLARRVLFGTLLETTFYPCPYKTEHPMLPALYPLRETDRTRTPPSTQRVCGLKGVQVAL